MPAAAAAAGRRTPPPLAPSEPGTGGAVDDRTVIQYAFGPLANLYADVLSVPPGASPALIQSAFFDRRYELYEILSQDTNGDKTAQKNDAAAGDILTPTERHFAERRMDAIVAAYRILSNPQTRAEYDEALAMAAEGGNKGSKGGKGTIDSSSVARPSSRGTSEAGGMPPTKTKQRGGRSRSRSLLRRTLSASPISFIRSASFTSKPSFSDLAKDRAASPLAVDNSNKNVNAAHRRASSSGSGGGLAMDDGEIRLQQQLQLQSSGMIPTQQLNPNGGSGGAAGRRLAAHLNAHSQPSWGKGRDDQTISTIGMRGATTPTRARTGGTAPRTPTAGILKKHCDSDETDRTRPVESDADEYDVHQAYTNDQGSEDEDGEGDGRRRRRRHRSSKASSKHNRSGRSSRGGRLSKYFESEKSESEGEDDEEEHTVSAESFPSSKGYDEFETLGCQALAPLDFLIRPGRVFTACKEEVTGVADDTTNAFDQVCNVFTLKGGEINAVVSEIEGARRELSPEQQQEAKAKAKSRKSKRGSARSGKDASSSKKSAAKSKSSSGGGGKSGKSKERTGSRSSSRRRS